jgi:hypothetical protein
VFKARSVTKLAGKIARTVARPEALTAYATLAAAVAAFMSVRAAERQERATFTSALYNKQVEVLATSVVVLDKYRAFWDPYTFRKTSKGWTGEDNADDALRQRVLAISKDGYSDERELRKIETDAVNALVAMQLVYPKEATPLLDDMKSSVRRSANYVTDLIWWAHGAYPKVTNVVATLHIPQRSYTFLEAATGALVQCSAEQLREGQNAIGAEFLKCQNAYPYLEESRKSLKER